MHQDTSARWTTCLLGNQRKAYQGWSSHLLSYSESHLQTPLARLHTLKKKFKFRQTASQHLICEYYHETIMSSVLRIHRKYKQCQKSPDLDKYPGFQKWNKEEPQNTAPLSFTTFWNELVNQWFFGTQKKNQ